MQRRYAGLKTGATILKTSLISGVWTTRWWQNEGKELSSVQPELHPETYLHSKARLSEAVARE